jgi:hypothetical protein
MNLGLFRREDWVTEVLYQFKVTLINDPAVFCQTEPVTEPDPLDVVHEWKSPDGRVLKGRFVETAAGRVTIDKEGARVDIPLGKLSPESKALAGKLAECAAVAVLSGNPDIRSSLASGPPLLSWTSAEGKAIEAEFVKLEGDVVSLRLKGREVPIPLNRLDDAGGKLARRLTEAAADPARATDG